MIFTSDKNNVFYSSKVEQRLYLIDNKLGMLDKLAIALRYYEAKTKNNNY